MKFQSVVPILYCTDMQKSFAYYTEQLGFEKKWEWGTPADFGSVGKDEVDIFLYLRTQFSPDACICVNLDNVDEYYELIKDSGAKILSKPDSKEWNMREMLIECPDGHIIRFGHNTDCD